MPTLSPKETKRFYDKFGTRQDKQAFYEDAAIDELISAHSWDEASTVYEFGCGTGRFALRLLDECLSKTARYQGVDLSDTMIRLTTDRLSKYKDRVQIALSEGSPQIDAPDCSLDVVVSNYVLDILPEDQIDAFIEEARRVLKPGGSLCLISLTNGTTPLSKIVTLAWKIIWNIRPSLLGGCRPISLATRFPADQWTIRHHKTVVAAGIPSEILIATSNRP